MLSSAVQIDWSGYFNICVTWINMYVLGGVNVHEQSLRNLKIDPKFSSLR